MKLSIFVSILLLSNVSVTASWDWFNEAIGKVGKVFTDIGETTKEEIDKIGNKIKTTVEDAGNKVAETAVDAYEKTEEGISNAADEVEKGIQEGVNELEKWKNTVANFFDDTLLESMKVIANPDILNKITSLISQLDKFGEIEAFLNKNGLADIQKVFSSDIIGTVEKFFTGDVATFVNKIIDEVGSEVEKEASLISKYFRVQDLYTEHLHPHFIRAEKVVRDFLDHGYEEEMKKFAELVIPPAAMEVINHPEEKVLEFVENQLLKVKEYKPVNSNIIDKFMDLIEDKSLQQDINDFVLNNKLVSGIVSIYKSAKLLVDTIVDISNSKNADDALRRFDIVKQVTKLIEGDLYANVTARWNKLNPITKITNAFEEKNLTNRFTEFANEEILINKISEIFLENNMIEKIVNFATDTKLHADIKKLVNGKELLDNLKQLVNGKILNNIEQTFTNDTIVQNAIDLFKDPTVLQNQLHHFGSIVNTPQFRVPRSIISPNMQIEMNKNQIEVVMKSLNTITKMPDFSKHVTFILDNYAGVQKMIDVFKNGQKIFEKLLDSKNLLRNFENLVKKQQSGLMKKVMGKVKSIAAIVSLFQESFIERKIGEVLGSYQSVEEIMRIGRDPDLRNMVKHVKHVLDNVDLLRDFSKIFNDQASVNRFVNIGENMVSSIEKFSVDILNNLQKFAENNIVSGINELGNIHDLESLGRALEKMADPGVFQSNGDVIDTIRRFAEDTTLIDGVVSFVDNFDMAGKLASLAGSIDKIHQMAVALTNVKGVQKIIHLLTHPQIVENMIGLTLDPELIKKMLTIIVSNVDLLEAKLKLYVNPDVIKMVVEFVCDENIVQKVVAWVDVNVFSVVEHYLKHIDHVIAAFDIVTDPARIRQVVEKMRPAWFEQFEQFIHNTEYVDKAFGLVRAIPTLTQLPAILENMDVLTMVKQYAPIDKIEGMVVEQGREVAAQIDAVKNNILNSNT